MQAGTRAVKEIMEKIERVRQKDGERGGLGGEQLKMEAAAMKSRE